MKYLNKSYFRKSLLALTFGLSLLVSYILGYQIAFRSWNKEISISYRTSQSSSRGLATNQGERKVATVSRDVYMNHQSLFTRSKSTYDNNKIQFSIGNIILVDQNGNKNFACQMFPQVDLYFEADGIFMRGERVSMKLMADCVGDPNHQFIGPFVIPAQKILNSSIVKQVFKTKEGEVHFNNVSLKWPKAWILKEVFFKSSYNQHRVRAQVPQAGEDFFSIEF